VQSSQYSKPNSFSAAQRISRSEGFKKCLQSNSVTNKNFKLFFVRNQLAKARLGIVVAKRYTPRAVDRNTVKRDIRELFRQHKVAGFGFDLVVIVRHIAEMDRSTYRVSLTKLFSRVET